MTETVLTVRVLNKQLGIGEKFARLGTMQDLFLFRKAWLSVTPEELALTCTNDLNSFYGLGAIPQEAIKRIRFKKSVYTPGQQLVNPALCGLVAGVIGNVVYWFEVGKRRVIGLDQAIGFGVLGILGLVVLSVLPSLFTIVWSNVAVVAFDSTDGTSVEVYIEDAKVDDLIGLFEGRAIPVEPNM